MEVKKPTTTKVHVAKEPSILPRATKASKAMQAAKKTSSSENEGQARAMERVRQKIKKVKMEDLLKKAMSPKPAKTMSTDERVARARERAKKRQLEKEASLRQSVRPAPAVKSRKPRPVLRHTPAVRSAPGRTASNSQVTVPKTPKFATTARRGEPKQVGKDKYVPMAASTDILKKGLREDLSHITPRTELTLPKTPHFATSKRRGEKYMTPGGGPKSVTLANSHDVLSSGLRQNTEPTTKRREPGTLTIPQAPKFHASTRRALPKSTEEQEAEMMDYYKSHPFKAAPVMQEDPKPLAPKAAPVRRKLTSPRPFQFQTDKRAELEPHAAAREEETFKFQARPMPNFNQPSTKAAPARTARKLTKPQPFRLTTESKVASNRKPEPVEPPVNTAFHARPLPKSTYEPPTMPAKPISPPSKAQAPKFSTEGRAEKRHELEEASFRRAETLAAERTEKKKVRQREQLQEAMEKAELTTPTKNRHTEVQPFAFSSDARHEKHQRELEERLRREEEERLRQSQFHAQPVPLTTYTPSPPRKSSFDESY